MDWQALLLAVPSSILVLGILVVINRWLTCWFVRRFVARHCRDWEKGVRAKVDSDFRVILTPREIVCEHPKRQRESVVWEEVMRVWYVTTSDGPWSPDAWLLFESKTGGCSVPTEAQNFESIWDELKVHFPGFNYEPMIHGGTDDARYLCWEKRA